MGGASNYLERASQILLCIFISYPFGEFLYPILLLWLLYPTLWWGIISYPYGKFSFILPLWRVFMSYSFGEFLYPTSLASYHIQPFWWVVQMCENKLQVSRPLPPKYTKMPGKQIQRKIICSSNFGVILQSHISCDISSKKKSSNIDWTPNKTACHYIILKSINSQSSSTLPDVSLYLADITRAETVEKGEEFLLPDKLPKETLQ